MKDHTKKTVPIAKNWAEDLASALNAGVETGHPGEGWVTILEYAKAAGLGRPGAQQSLERALRAGDIVLIKRRFNGRITNFYKKK